MRKGRRWEISLEDGTDLWVDMCVRVEPLHWYFRGRDKCSLVYIHGVNKSLSVCYKWW